jgi:hypothetical protein
VIGPIVKRLARRVIRGLVRARLLVVIVLGLGLIAAALGVFQSFQSGSFNLSLPGPGHAPEATENFLKGNQNYDAQLILASLSQDAVERGRARNAIQEHQQRLEQARERGIRMEQFDYVGGQALPDGTSLQFYVVAMRGLGGRPELEYVPYVFTLDRSGKIVRIQ